MKNWHRIDVFAALIVRGWSKPETLAISPERAEYVGEAYVQRRDDQHLELYFVADFGTGLQGLMSIEAVVALPADEQLWLRRTRDAKWRRALAFWANRVSGMAPPEGREPNTVVQNHQLR